MPWTCPNCQRQFKTVNQWHSCESHSIDSLLEGKPAEIVELYEDLARRVVKLANVRIEATRNAVMFKSPVTFLAFKPRKDGAIIEFCLARRVDEFPIYKVVQISKQRWAHIAALENKGDLTREIMAWIKESHRILTQQSTK